MNDTSDPTNGSGVPGDLPQLKEWLPIARRLRQLSKQQMGPAVVVLRLVVDEQGQPRVYSVDATKIEPRAMIEEILAWLSPGGLT